MKHTLAKVLGGFLAAYALHRIRLRLRARRAARKMVPDYLGNYDMDGASYDPLDFRVVVVGDGHSSKTEPEMASPAEIREIVEVQGREAREAG